MNKQKQIANHAIALGWENISFRVDGSVHMERYFAGSGSWDVIEFASAADARKALLNGLAPKENRPSEE